jgi:hypothetical protein
MERSQVVRLLGLVAILACFVFLAILPGGGAQADGGGGFPTSTAVIIIIPTSASSPTAPMILNVPSPNPYPFPLPQNDNLSKMLPEAQAEAAVIPEEGGSSGFSTYLCIPVVIVVVIMALIGLNRIRKNYQGG